MDMLGLVDRDPDLQRLRYHDIRNTSRIKVDVFGANVITGTVAKTDVPGNSVISDSVMNLECLIEAT